jgi:hypothetical protein
MIDHCDGWVAGNPLFLLTIGQFYEVLVHNALLVRQRKRYMKKFSPTGTGQGLNFI